MILHNQESSINSNFINNRVSSNNLNFTILSTRRDDLRTRNRTRLRINLSKSS